MRRNIDLKENEQLSNRISELKKSLGVKPNWFIIIALIVITIVSAFHIYYFDKSNWSLISKFLVCVAPIVLWVLVEQYFKRKKNGNRELESLVEIEVSGQVSVFPIDLNKIAKLEEYEDEGDLYLIETKDKKCIYLWDNEFYLADDKNFPSDRMEVYVEDAFKYGIGRKVKCIGNKMAPIIIKGDYKWSYFGKVGLPEDLQVEDKPFDAIIEEIKNEGLQSL